ncbi:MAG: ABC transporter substrate-binding protein [Chloroflexi bacterium]|nr:ABC transporter substrate-binding protein [Chloroflexota bacterium]
MRRRRNAAVAAFLVLLVLLPAACKADDEPSEGGATGNGDTTGVTATEIKFGTHLPLSQSPAAAYGPIADGMRAYFDYVNETEGGVYGRKLSLIVGDDHYTPSDTVEVTRRLVEQDKVFAIIAGLGEETHEAVWKYLEERGVPDLFISSGLARWSDPVVKTRFGGNPVYLQEGQMLGRYVVEHYTGKKLGLLLQNNEFGQDGEKGVRKGIEGSDVQIAAIETYESVQWDVTAQTQRLKNAGVDVVLTYAIPPPAASLVKTAREVLNWDVPIIVTGVDATELFLDLAGAQNAEGVVSVVFGHQAHETDHPGVKAYLAAMEKYAPGIEISNITLYGFAMGELAVEGLKRAGQDLTRESFVTALEGIRKFQCSVCLTPISFSEQDHRPFEIEVYIKVVNGRWETFGEPVDFETTKE